MKEELRSVKLLLELLLNDRENLKHEDPDVDKGTA